MANDMIVVEASKLIEEDYRKVFEDDTTSNGVVFDNTSVKDKYTI